MQKRGIILLLSVFLGSQLYGAVNLPLEKLATQQMYIIGDYEYFQVVPGKPYTNQDSSTIYRITYYDIGYRSVLPFDGRKFPNLQELVVISNHTQFPREITSFPNLQVLSLQRICATDVCRGNYVIEFPKEFWKLKELKVLDLSENPLRELPEDIVQLSKLEAISLFSPNSTYELKDFSGNVQPGSIPDETYSGAGRYYLEHLPLSLFRLFQLKALYIRDIESMPELTLLANYRPEVLTNASNSVLTDSLLWGTGDFFHRYMAIRTQLAKSKHKAIDQKSFRINFDPTKSINFPDSVVISDEQGFSIQTRVYSQGRPYGKWLFNDPQSHRIQRENLYGDQGLLMQTRFFYFSSGALMLEESSLNGTLSSAWKCWYENGNLQSDGYFENGKFSGTWKLSYEDSTYAICRFTYRHNQRLCFYSHFTDVKTKPKEQLIMSGPGVVNSWNDIDRNNQVQFFDEADRLVTSISYDNTGQISKRVEYQYDHQDLPFIKTVWLYEKGIMTVQENYCLDRKALLTAHDYLLCGDRTEYFENGKEKAKAAYENGVLNGPSLKWDENGKLIEEKNYKNGTEIK